MCVCVCVCLCVCRDFRVLVTVVVDQVSKKRWQEHGTQAASRYGHSVGEPAVFDEVRSHDEYARRERQACAASEHHPVTETQDSW